MDNPWTGWRAIIGSTGHADSFGVLWRNAPAMERRGGYSGPYDKRQDAEAGARSWAASWDMDPDADLTIEHVDILPE